MKSSIHALRQRKAEIVKGQRALLDKANTEERNLIETEAAQYEDNIKKLASLEEQIIREEKVMEMERSMSANPDEDAAFAARSGVDNPQAGDKADAQKRPFATLGEQLIAVARSSMGGFRTD